MSTTQSSFFPIKPHLTRLSTYYIVKDDFIVNLKRGCQAKHRTIKTQEKQSYEALNSSLMVCKKRQIFSKMKFRGNNNFYDLERQIKDNSKSLYRKLNVALLRSRVQCKVKLQNPFLKNNRSEKPSSKYFSQQKSLQKLIFNVQPYWVKRTMTKSVNKINKKPQ